MVGDIKHIIVIESLVGEKQTGKELYNDCIRRRIDLYNRDFSHAYYGVYSKHEFEEILRYYQINSEYLTSGIVIHLEMHGDVNLEGLILANNELINWNEIVDLLRPINIATKNRLFITMATCYGRFLYKGVDAQKKSPYSGYISAKNEIVQVEIEEKFEILFEQLIEKGNLLAAYTEMEKSESNFYYKDSESTFEEAYKTVHDDLTNNIEYKTNFRNNSYSDAERLGQPIPDDETFELIFKKELLDTYITHKDAFNFPE